MLKALAISGYRSLRDLVVPLSSLNLITGPNGSGKSSLYRAMRLLADSAQGNIIQSLAREGGLSSTLWAGPETISQAVRSGEFEIEGQKPNKPIRLKLGFASDEYSYLIELGLPIERFTMFARDPDIKRECMWHGERLRPSSLLLDRHGAVAKVRSDDGIMHIAAQNLPGFESVLMRLTDPRDAPELLLLRDSIRAWRFYDHFRADPEAPARMPQVGTRTPVLDQDGHDLAAAIQTIIEVGHEEGLSQTVSDAFPGGRIHVETMNGRFLLKMQQRGLLRSLDAQELSDGTLRYL